MTASRTIWPPYQLPVAVVQPLPGIGDMVWHLPHIRAIAAHAGEPVTLLTKPRSLADQLLPNEPAVSDIQWVDLNPSDRRGAHDGVGGFLRLVRKLRAGNFGTIVMLHHSDLLAAAAWMAGIPDRRGYGWGRQRWFLNTGPFLPGEVKKMHQHTRATRYLAAAGVPMESAEPMLTVPHATRVEAMARLANTRVVNTRLANTRPETTRPETISLANTDAGFVAIGIGGSEALRQWGAERFGELASVLLDSGWPALVLVGGQEDMMSANAIVGSLGERAVRVRLALGWNLADVMGVLADAAFYVGNNTGVMNIAAAIGVRTYALFGTTPTFDHASQIVPVTAPDIGVHDGMARLRLVSVLDVIQADRGRLSP
jgi:heptosyltransferase-2